MSLTTIYKKIYYLLQIGWKPFGKDSSGNGCGRKLINILYVLLIISLVLYTYVYDIMACQWKLDLKTDTKVQCYGQWANRAQFDRLK